MWKTGVNITAVGGREKVEPGGYRPLSCNYTVMALEVNLNFLWDRFA